MSNNRELKIILKADGSIAVEELNKVEKELTDLGKGASKTGKEVEKLDKELNKTGKDATEAAKKIDQAEKEIADLGKGATRTSQEIERLDKSFIKSSDDSNRFAKALGGMGSFLRNAGHEIKGVRAELGEYSLAINQSLELLGRFKRYADEVWEFAKQGAQLRAARDSFADYARSVNKSSTEILSKLRISSGGTIDDMNLVKSASLAMSLGVTQDASKMANLLEIARNKARLFGISTQQAFEDIVTGIGRTSPKILDNLGIRIPAAFEKMTEGMSDTEKVAKLFDLTLEEGNKQLRDMGALASNNADQMSALGASWKNMKGSSGELVSKVFSPVIAVLDEIIAKADVAAKELNILIDSATGAISGREEKNAYQSFTNSQLITQKSFLEDEIRSFYFANRTEDGSVTGGPIPEEKSLEAIKKEIERRKDDLIKVSKEAASEASAAINEVWGKFANKFNLNESLYDKAKRERLAAEKAGKDAENAKKKSGENEKEAERLAAERQKRLLQAAQIDADSQWKILSQSVEDAALAPLGKIVDEYELTGKKSIQGLLEGLEIGAASIAGANVSLSGLNLDKLIVEDFKKVEAGADQMQKVIEVASEKAIANLMAISAAAAGENNQGGIYAALMKVSGYAEKIPDLINKVKAEVVSEEVGDYNKLRYESIPTIDVGDMGKEKTQKDKLSKIIAEAVSAGFANVDFSNFSQTFGNILSQILAKSVAQSNPIMDTAGKISWGNVGTNLAVSWAIGRLTGAGGLFGARKENGKEAVQQAATLREQMGQAYLKSYETQNLAYLYGNGGNAYLNQLNAGRNSYFGTQIGYNWEDSGNGIWSKKTRTYELVDNGASAALKRLTDAIEAAEKFNRNVERGYELMIAQGNDFKALVEQSVVYQNANKYVLDGERGLSWTDGSKDSADLSESAHEIRVAAAELARQLGQATADRVSFTSEGFTKYAPWLNSIQTPGSTRVNAGSGLRVSMRDLGLPYDTRPREYKNFADMDSLSSTQQYDAFFSLQTDFLDRKISTYLIDMVKQAGKSMFDLNSLQITDLDAYQTEYVGYLDKQMQAVEEVMRRQEEIFMDEAKSYEERTSALEIYERNMTSYHQFKLDKLRLEKQQQEEENRLIAEQRQAKIEAGLSLVGEMSQRGDRVVILQGGDVDAALTEYMAEFADNPEVLAVLRKAKTKMDATARWG